MTRIDFMETLEGMTGDVLQEDIAEGVRGDCKRCPVARAVERMFPEHFPIVMAFTTYVDEKVDGGGKTLTALHHSYDLETWICDFDDKVSVEPIRLVIKRDPNATGVRYELDIGGVAC